MSEKYTIMKFKIHAETAWFILAMAFMCGTTVYHFIDSPWRAFCALMIVFGFLWQLRKFLTEATETIDFWKNQAMITERNKQGGEDE